MTPSDFSGLVSAVHRVGTAGALLEFPEASSHKALLTRLELAEQLAEEKEAELLRAQAHVDSIEADLRAQLVGEEA